MTTEKKRLSTLLTLAAFILLVPLIAMQFTEEVKWTLTDFIIAGGLLSGTGFAIEVTLRKLKKDTSRVIVLAAVLIVFLMVCSSSSVKTEFLTGVRGLLGAISLDTMLDHIDHIVALV
ncbi:MAG: hypothetical protein ACPG8K_02710, partial [Crocinitomicaceae bacterium]